MGQKKKEEAGASKQYEDLIVTVFNINVRSKDRTEEFLNSSFEVFKEYIKSHFINQFGILLGEANIKFEWKKRHTKILPIESKIKFSTKEVKDDVKPKRKKRKYTKRDKSKKEKILSS